MAKKSPSGSVKDIEWRSSLVEDFLFEIFACQSRNAGSNDFVWAGGSNSRNVLLRDQHH